MKWLNYGPLFIFLILSFMMKGQQTEINSRIGRYPANWELIPYKNWTFVIESRYKTNKKIWGTYNLISERVRPGKNCERACKKMNLETNGNLIFRKKIVTFLKSPSTEGITRVRVESLPYTRNLVRKGADYKISTKKKSAYFGLYEHVYQQIIDAHREYTDPLFRVGAGHIEITSSICKRRRMDITCSHTVSMKVPDIERMPRIKQRNTGPIIGLVP